MCSKVNEKRKSKLLLTLFALGITLTLCGCMKSVELKERTIIRMVGVDVDGQDFVLTMSQFSPTDTVGRKIFLQDAGGADEGKLDQRCN